MLTLNQKHSLGYDLSIFTMNNIFDLKHKEIRFEKDNKMAIVNSELDKNFARIRLMIKTDQKLLNRAKNIS